MNRRFQRVGHRKKVVKQRPPKPYDSWFEHDLHKRGLAQCNHHPFTVTYTIERSYEVDFVPVKDENILIECKGYFRDRKEAAKYVYIKESNPDYELVFVFSNGKKPMPGASVRKDGTKQSMADWAEKNGFRWFTPDTLPKEWGN